MPAKNNAPRTLTWKGRTRTLVAWAKEIGVSEQTLRARLDRLKWPLERALTAAVDARFVRSPGRPQKEAPRSPPKLARHAGGQAYVRWMEGGKRKQAYFGPWKSAKAREGYARLLAAWADGVGAGRPKWAPAWWVKLWVRRSGSGVACGRKPVRRRSPSCGRDSGPGR